MSNFIGMVFATLKKEGIDTSKMDTSEAIAKYNEIKGTGGENAKGDESSKETTKQAQDGGNETVKEETELDQSKERDDKYFAHNDKRSINKAIKPDEVERTISGWNGGGYVDLVLPGGKWGQIRPQTDGSFLARSPKGQTYCKTPDEAKQKLIADIGSNPQGANAESSNKLQKSMGITPDEARAFATGKGTLSKDGGYNGVSNAKDAPTFEYKSNPYVKGAKFKNPAGVEFEVVEVTNNKQGIPFVKLKDAQGEFEIEQEQLERLGWLK